MNQRESGIFLGLGSNSGDRLTHIRAAVDLLDSTADISIRKSSSVFVSPAWGGVEQEDFLNAVIEIETILNPQELLKTVKNLEKKIGRKKSAVRWGPRIIDIDILVYGQRIINTPELTIPHRYCSERLFVLTPLVEIAPGLIHPETGVSFAEYLHRLQQKTKKTEETCSIYKATNPRRP